MDAATAKLILENQAMLLRALSQTLYGSDARRRDWADTLCQQAKKTDAAIDDVRDPPRCDCDDYLPSMAKG